PMRFFHCCSALSAGMLSLLLAGEALAASPGLVTRVGRFPAASISGAKRASASALEKAARSLLVEQIPASSGAELGIATTTELADGERVVKIPQLHQGLPVAHRGVAVTFGADDVARVISAKLEDELPP